MTRQILVDVLIYHYRDGIKGCGCGWNELGRSWPEHVVTVYEESVAARTTAARPLCGPDNTFPCNGAAWCGRTLRCPRIPRLKP